MAVYIYITEKKQGAHLGSDGLVYIDGRLSKENKAIQARKKIENLRNIKPNFDKGIFAIALFTKSRYEAGKYYYEAGVIKL
jgi:hypothetical protein